MTLIATQVKRRRGTTAENDAFTGAEGEITVDLTTHELRVHDGSTVGGHTIPTKDNSYSKAESDNLLSNKADVALDNLTNAGKEVCAHMAMPGDTAQAITFGASGTIYTAPADGFFILRAENSELSNHWVNVTAHGKFIGNYWAQVKNNSFGLPPFFIRKGGTIKFVYGSDIRGGTLYFVKCVGAQ